MAVTASSEGSTFSTSIPQRPATNALSSKVSSVLTSSFSDPETRTALGLLDTRGITNNAETRRQLRLDIQKDVIESNGAVIQEFGHVAEQLRRIGQSIATLNKGYTEMRQHIDAARLETQPMLSEASSLLIQKAQGARKQQLLKAFQDHFIISENDIAILTSSAEPLNEAFFTILSRAKKIQIDCEVLLGAENQRLGQEIMDQTSKNINAAFQKLYRWVQREFKSLNLENPQIGAEMRRALRVLAERPMLFQACLDAFAETRQHNLSDAFFTAMTGMRDGREDKSIKPIELVAHDALRYVGDMLAWTHSTTVSEREALEVLFISEGDEIAKSIQAGRDNEPWNRYAGDESNAFDGLKALNELVDKDVTGVAQALRQRISQVVQSHEDTILAYKLANLLNFYRLTFSKLLGKDSILLDALVVLEESSLRQFRSLMRDHVANIEAETQQQAPPKDLSPPDFFLQALSQLTAIAKTYDTSLSTAASREDEFQPILTEACEPFLKIIDTMCTKLATKESAIFSINCLLATKSALSIFDFTTSTITRLTTSIEQSSSTLTDIQHNFILHQSGINPLLSNLPTLPENSSNSTDIRNILLQNPAFSSQALRQASATLDNFLPSALMDAMDNLKFLQSMTLAREVTEQAVEMFCDDFEGLEDILGRADEVIGEKEGEVVYRELFPRTSGEIRVLLS